MALVFPGVEPAVPSAGHADPVDAQQRAVEDDVGLPDRDLDRLLEGGCERGEQVQGLTQVAVGRGGADPEPAAGDVSGAAGQRAGRSFATATSRSGAFTGSTSREVDLARICDVPLRDEHGGQHRSHDDQAGRCEGEQPPGRGPARLAPQREEQLTPDRVGGDSPEEQRTR